VPNLFGNLKLAFGDLLDEFRSASTRRALKKRLNPTGLRGFYPPVILFDHILPRTDKRRIWTAPSSFPDSPRQALGKQAASI